MPRRRLSEYRAKQLVSRELGGEYRGWEVTPEMAINEVTRMLDGRLRYVVKVDQAVKGRFKKGLVLLEVKKVGVEPAITYLRGEGYDSFLIEPQVTHDEAEERYIAFSLDRAGISVAWSRQGGVDIEHHKESIQSARLDDTTEWAAIADGTGLSQERLRALRDLFCTNHLVFLEINPYTVVDGVISLLDCAIEVDDAGEYFSHGWSSTDIRSPKANQSSDEERTVRLLNEKSPASFNLNVLNPNGSVFLLLSGGGASVVVADEVYNRGLGEELANYGEYSGNPNQDETELYTRAVLSLLLKSKSKRKVLLIGGAVANFTDIANTFTGVIAAIDAVADELRAQGVRVFVRRGGPRQEIGLAKIEDSLRHHGILGSVHTPATPLTDVVSEALREVKS